MVRGEKINSQEFKLEGELKDKISSPYVSRTGTTFYVARLLISEEMQKELNASERELTLFFWEDRFDYETKLKIQELTAGEHIIVNAQKRTNPNNGEDNYHVTKFGEEAEIF